MPKGVFLKCQKNKKIKIIFLILLIKKEKTEIFLNTAKLHLPSFFLNNHQHKVNQKDKNSLLCDLLKEDKDFHIKINNLIYKTLDEEILIDSNHLFINEDLSKENLKKIISIIEEIDLKEDVLNYYLEDFINIQGKKEYKKQTPKSIAKLMIKLAEPHQGKIYDSSCGIGNIFLCIQEQKNKESKENYFIEYYR